MSGRPLRFLGVVLGGWVAVRVMLLSQAGPGVELATTPTPKPPSAPSPSAPVAWASIPPALPLAAPRPRSFTVATAHPSVGAPWQRHPGDPDRVALALLGLTRLGPSEPVGVVAAVRDDPATTPALAFPKPAPGASRLSGSVWLVARAGNGLGQSPLGGQLGGSQAGIRVAYAVDRQRRVALVGRIATPLAGSGREAAAGVEWQPTRVPVRIVAEQRLAIDGGGGGPAVGVVGGVGPVPIGNFRLEAYGQAGVIGRGRGRGVGYADGAVRIDRPIAKRHGVTLAAGLGAWAAAQPDAERIDVGPVLAATVPIADHRVRVALEWRARVGGSAAPGSGLALSIGGDF